MTKLNRELILSLACEGGLLRIYRHFDQHGVQHFSADSIGSGGLDTSDLEHEAPNSRRKRRASKKTPTYDSLEAVMNAEGLNGFWVRFTPLEIHPDFRNDIRELRRKVIASTDCKSDEHSDLEWSMICGRPEQHSASERSH